MADQRPSQSVSDVEVILATLENALELAAGAGVTSEQIAESVAHKTDALRPLATALQDAAGTLSAAATWTTDSGRARRLYAAADRARDAAKGVC